MTRVRKSLIAIALLFACTAFVASAWVLSINWKVSSYDSYFRQRETLGHISNVLWDLGPPYSQDKLDALPPATKADESPFGISRFYVYQVDRLFSPPLRWTIGVDADGMVVSRHRDANGC